MQLRLELCSIVLLYAGATSAAPQDITCTGSGGVTCGGKARLGYADLKAGTQVGAPYCNIRDECDVSQLNSHDAKCVSARYGYDDPPYNKVLLFIGLYTEEGDFLFCQGKYASGWGKDGCTC